MKITREKLRELILEELNEMSKEGEVDEALGGFLKGAAGALGSKVGKAVGAAGGALGKAASATGGALGKAASATGGALKRGAAAVGKQVGDVAQAGKQMSMKQNITNAQNKVNALRAQLEQAEEELLDLQANA